MREWKLYVDEDKVPHIIVVRNGKDDIPTIAECEKAIMLLNEEDSTTVKLHCRNPVCSDLGGWIERTRDDAKRTVYACDTCGKSMQR